MLLSRVAERVYWAGRYLERAEGTARLVQVHTELFLDLPLSAGVGWSPLLAVTGTGIGFDELARPATEDEIVRFLAVDSDNASSIRSSIASARENLRATRALLPREAWEAANDLHHMVHAADAAAVDRHTRLGWTDDVIRRCHAFNGIVSSTMSHDATYAFLEIGRHLERADMTTRVLDVQAGMLLGVDAGALSTYADVTWMSVLRSVAAHQMFRRSVDAVVSGSEALRYLLRDAQFPRSVEHCLTEVSRSLLELPGCDGPMSSCADVQATLEDLSIEALDPIQLHDLVERVQDGIGTLHEQVHERFFAAEATAPPESLVPA